MKHTEPATLELDGRELELVARRIIARHLTNPDWLQWEDYPYLSEASFIRLCDAVEKLIEAGFAAIKADELFWDIDAQELIQRAEDGPYNQAAAE